MNCFFQLQNGVKQQQHQKLEPILLLWAATVARVQSRLYNEGFHTDVPVAAP